MTSWVAGSGKLNFKPTPTQRSEPKGQDANWTDCSPQAARLSSGPERNRVNCVPQPWAVRRPSAELLEANAIYIERLIKSMEAAERRPEVPTDFRDSDSSSWSRRGQGPVGVGVDADKGRSEQDRPLGDQQQQQQQHEQLEDQFEGETIRPLGFRPSGHGLARRAWRQSQRRPSTFQVSAEEARRFLETQRRVGHPALAAALQRQRNHLMSAPRPSRGQFASGTAGDAWLRSDRMAIRFHRSELQAKEEQQQLQQLQQQQQQVEGNLTVLESASRPRPTGSGGGGSSATSPLLECAMRQFTFRALKSDETGNKCWGHVTANICLGGCDTGEIADWLFPYKKSIHKVCRHGRRLRRRVQLESCSSEQVADSLRDYYFVDAIDCVCKKCTSADTTCLGSMSRPNLRDHGWLSDD